MKNYSLLLLLGACLVLTGCARNYELRLTNGNRITATTKPKLEKGFYVFKDGRGQETAVSQGRVQEIAPAGRAQEKQSFFRPTPGR